MVLPLHRRSPIDIRNAALSTLANSNAKISIPAVGSETRILPLIPFNAVKYAPLRGHNLIRHPGHSRHLRDESDESPDRVDIPYNAYPSNQASQFIPSEHRL